MEAEELDFANISIGETRTFGQVWTEEDVATFARLSGDMNPLHMDEDFAKKTQFGKRIVHGMLVASSFSKLVGMHLPGKNCLYLKQDLVFKRPIFIGDELIVTGTVVSKSEATRMLDLKMTVSKKDEIAIEGVAKVQVLSSQESTNI